MALSAAAVAALAGGCFIGIDETKLDRPIDGGVTSDALAAGDGGDAAGDPSQRDLLGQWSFEEPSGTVALDSSGKGNDGDLVGPVKHVAGLRAGNGIETIRSNIPQFFECPRLSNTSFPSAGTLSFWYRANVEPSAGLGEGDLVDVAELGRAKLHIRHLLEVSGEAIEIRFDSASSTIAVADIDLVRGAWNHIVVSWDPLNGAVYAGPEGSALGVMKATFASEFRPNQEMFQLATGVVGFLDEVRLYGRMLDESEVRRIP